MSTISGEEIKVGVWQEHELHRYGSVKKRELRFYTHLPSTEKIGGKYIDLCLYKDRWLFDHCDYDNPICDFEEAKRKALEVNRVHFKDRIQQVSEAVTVIEEALGIAPAPPQEVQP